MHRTIEAIIHPDGRVEVLEPVAGVVKRRALLTILDEPPPTPHPGPQSEAERFEAALRAAGLLDVVDDIPDDLHMMTDEERAAMARRILPGTPLSEIIIEEREERF
jgi:hypothetical protein